MELKNFFAQDANGNVIAYPVAYLYLAGTTTLASGLQNAAGSALDNPFTGDVKGQLQVAVADGAYDLRVAGAGRDFTMRVRFADGAAVAQNASAAQSARDQAVAANGTAQTAATAAQTARTGAEAAASTVQGIASLTPRLSTDFFSTGNLNYQAVRDKSGVLGGGANQIYLPNVIQYRRGDGTVRGNVSNPTSQYLPGYCQLAIPNTDISYIWYDISDTTYKVTSFAGGTLDMNAASAANLVRIGEIQGNYISFRCSVVEADDYISDTTLDFRYPLIKEGGVLLIPAYYVRGFGINSPLLRDPTNGAGRYAEIPISTSAGSVAHCYHDELGVATFVGSISGATLTVTQVIGGTVKPGQALTLAGAPLGVSITANGTGTGGNGTYTVNPAATVAASTLTGAASAFVKTASDNAAGASRGFRRATIARSINGRIHTPYAIAGDVPGGSVPNQCPYGKNPDGMTYLSGTVVSDTANTALQALGHTRSFKSSNASPAGQNVIAGMDIPDRRLGGSSFFRLIVGTNTADTYGAVSIFFQTAAGTAITSIQLQMEKRIDANTAIFSGKIAIPTTAAWAALSRFQAAVTGVSGVTQEFTGVQFHHSGQVAEWIMRDDFPVTVPDALRIAALETSVYVPSGTDLKPLFGDELFMVSDRPLPIYPRNLTAYRADFDVLSVSIESPAGLPTPISTPTDSKGEAILLDPAKMATAATMKARPLGLPSTRYTKALSVSKRTVPVTGSPAPKILAIGDSITRRGTLALIGQCLTAWGFAPAFIGTVEGEAATSTSYTGPVGEGREGWALSDFFLTRQDADVSAVLQPGNEATYSAATSSVRQSTNPFLKAAASSSSAAPTITYGGTDYKFDLSFYQSRFGLATPDIVLLNLGKNDQLEQSAATALSDVTTLYDAMIAEIRRVWPSVKIICWATTMPYSGSTSWQNAWHPLIRAMNSIIRTRRIAGDANLHLCSTWAHCSQEGFALNAGTVDAATGVTTTTFSDEIHPIGTSRLQHAEALAAAVACLA